MPDKKPAFGQIAVQLGLVTQSQVNQGLEQLRLKELQGVRVGLGQVLIEMGVLSAEQVREVIGHQDKELLTCSNASCATRYNIRNFDQNKRYACKKCGCPLGIVPMRKPPHFDAEAGDSAAMPSLTDKDVQRAMAQASQKFVIRSGTGVPPVENHGQDAHATFDCGICFSGAF